MLLLSLVAACSLSGPKPLAVPSITPAAHPLLIKHGWDIPSAAFVHAHVAAMEKQPFDGVIILMPELSKKVQSRTPVSYEQFRQALAPVAATRFTTLKHNFVMVYSAPAGDLFADWSVPVANFANLARAARAAGFEGVFYDNEEYFGAALHYPGSCLNRTVTQCQAQAETRGRQVMDAMRSQWPAVRVIAPLGPWVSDPATASHLPGAPYANTAHANPLIGAFGVGMVASTVGTKALLVDGGEIYTPRTAQQFATVKTWQKQGMATRGTLVPAVLKPYWADAISAGFGVYDRPRGGVAMDADTWGTTLANALATTDKYVWAYTERYDWWGTGWPAQRAPAAWVQATRTARASR